MSLIKMLFVWFVCVSVANCATGKSTAHVAPWLFLALVTSMAVAFGVAVSVSPCVARVKRMLVLTDVGEECDDESALWMMLKVLNTDSSYEADVVFCTGDPDLRRNRWVSIIRDVSPLCQGRIRYFRGNGTKRAVRHVVPVVEEGVLVATGLHDVPAYEGGSYDVVVQMSPLGDSETPLGALERVMLSEGAIVGSYILIGTEGSTNYDKNSPIHDLFKAHLVANGFLMGCVAQENYALWTRSCTSILIPKLQDEVFTDEWMKAIGRINPEAVNLFVRFRVNVMVNYSVIRSGFAELEEKFRDDPLFSQAADWWTELRDPALEKIRGGYIQLSRDKDNLASFSYGSALMGDMIKGQKISWMDLVTPAAQSDFAVFVKASPEGILEKCNVDTVMSWALLLMTERMARTWAFATMQAGGQRPEASVLDEYFEKSLAGSHFPKLPVFKNEAERMQLDDIKMEFTGNPQYDPSGMYVALALLAGDADARKTIHQKLDSKSKLIADAERAEALSEAYKGRPPEYLLNTLIQGKLPPKK